MIKEKYSIRGDIKIPLLKLATFCEKKSQMYDGGVM